MSNSNTPFKLDKNAFIRLLIPFVILFSVVALSAIIIKVFTGQDFFEITIKNGLISGHIPTILDEAGELVIVTLGMTLVIAVSGGVDLSVGSIMAIAASFCGLLLNGSEYRSAVFHSPYILALLVGLVGGGLCGAFNGFLVSRLKLQPMIATLILFTAGRSIAKMITFGQTIYIMNPVYKYLGVQFPGVPLRTTIMASIAIVIIVALFTRLTSLGLYIQSVGINGSSSRLVGLNSRKIQFVTFVICGVLAGAAGLVASSSIASVNSGELGLNVEMDAILAVALGGNNLNGGKFSIVGSVVGAYTIQAITTTLYAVNVPPSQLYVYKALIIVLIIVLSSDVFKRTVRELFRRNVSVGEVTQ